VRQDLAENLVNGFLAGAPAGGWLPATMTADVPLPGASMR